MVVGSKELGTSMDGYYGHVNEVSISDYRPPIVMVSLQGRVGGPVCETDLDLDGTDPWVFYEHELEAVD